MVEWNKVLDNLSGDYLFEEIRQRVRRFKEHSPEASIISLGIGDTVLPIPDKIAEAMAERARALATPEGYSGYGPPGGDPVLRRHISRDFYAGKFQVDEITISDGAKSDLSRILQLFGEGRVALQNPTYPAYIGALMFAGRSRGWDAAIGRYKDVVYIDYNSANRFDPDPSSSMPARIIILCSPNNPTGEVMTAAQLKRWIDHARSINGVIIFDRAYSPYLSDPLIPRTIYDVEGAREVAIEIGSFSKIAGFTGVRLGWCVIPKELRTDQGKSFNEGWLSMLSQIYNGPSNIAQAGGIAILREWESCLEHLNYYRENGIRLKKALENLGWLVYGGIHAPYLWVKTPWSSWEAFDRLLSQYHLVAAPGIGFGPSGEGFLRLTTFALRKDVDEVVRRLNL